MRKQDCYVGMPVSFGRENGERTQAKVVKCNSVRAKVQTTETRGSGRGSAVGSTWVVPYEMLTAVNPADAAVNPANPAAPEPIALKYNPFSQDNFILSALLGVYLALEPEALTCDGEASPAQIRQKRTELQRKLKGLQYALGYEVSESQVFNWGREESEYAQKRQRSNLVQAFADEAARNINAERTSEICGLPQGLPEGHPNAVQNWNGQY